jgi:hypothetical protein
MAVHGIRLEPPQPLGSRVGSGIAQSSMPQRTLADSPQEAASWAVDMSLSIVCPLVRKAWRSASLDLANAPWLSAAG